MSNDLFKIIVTGIAIIGLLAVFMIWFVIMYRKNYVRYVQEKKLLESYYQQELLRTQLEIQEQTFKTISQEIHDNIGQVLSLTKLNLSMMERVSDATLKEQISDSKKLLSKAIQNLRDLSKSMNTDNIQAIGLARAIEYELELVRKADFDSVLEIEGGIVRLDSQKELILFRIMQEALNNIIKHAEATAIHIKLVYTSEVLLININDNGKGMDCGILSTGIDAGKGLGLRNMHNRAELIGAQLNIDSKLGYGVEIAIVVPV